MAMASAPPVTPMPHCLDCRSFLVVAFFVGVEDSTGDDLADPFSHLDWSDIRSRGRRGRLWELRASRWLCGWMLGRWRGLSCVLEVAVAVTVRVDLSWEKWWRCSGAIGGVVSGVELRVESSP